MRHALSINPEGDYAKSSLATLQLLDGKATEALATFQSIGLESFRDSGVAIAQHMLRNTQASQTALDTLIAQAATSGPYQIAEVYAWRGEKDLAFEWLERAYHLQDAVLQQFKLDPLLASLYSDPRDAAMVKKLNLPP